MKLPRIAEVFVLVGIVILLGGSVSELFSMQADRYQEEAYANHLEIVSKEKARQVTMFLEIQANMAQMVSDISWFAAAARDPTNTRAVTAAQSITNGSAAMMPGLSLIDRTGTVIVADPAVNRTAVEILPQHTLEDEVTFQRYYDPVRRNDYFAIVAPIIDDGEWVGSIMYDIELSAIDDILGGIDQDIASEVMLVDRHGALVSTSRLNETRYTVLVQEVKTEQAQQCAEHYKEYVLTGSYTKTETPLAYESYRGESVFGAHGHVFPIFSCVIAEKSTEQLPDFSLTGLITGSIHE